MLQKRKTGWRAHRRPIFLVLSASLIGGLLPGPASALLAPPPAGSSGAPSRAAAATPTPGGADGFPQSTATPSMGGKVLPDGSYHQTLAVDVPAFHGLEPRVGVGYASGAGNGLAGWGWSLFGDSSIERTSRGRGVPALDSSDVFTLDGLELIPCAKQKTPGPSCIAGGTHSTERETFRRVTFESPTWSVWDTNGTRSTYRDASPSSAPGTVWRLDEQRNTHGDRVRYHRWCDGSDACYLKEIEYEDSANPAERTRIQFRYAVRPDPFTYAAGPALVSVRYRLTAVLISTAGSNRNALVLEYWPKASGPWSRESQLKTATRYGTDVALDSNGGVLAGTPHPAEFFAKADTGRQPGGLGTLSHEVAAQFGPLSWQDDGGTSYGEWNSTTSIPFETTYPASQRWMTLDANGDGRTDLLGAQREKNAQGVEVIRLRMAMNDGDNKWVHTSQLTSWEMGSVVSPRWRLVPGDFDGDGRTDIANIFWDYPTSRLMAEIALSDGQGSFALQGRQATGVTVWQQKARWMAGDVDGDGRTDLAGARPLAPDTTYSYTHAGLVVAFTAANGMIASVKSTTTSWRFRDEDAPHWFVGDQNGDGRADLLRVVQLPPTSQWNYWHAGLGTALSNGDGTWALNQTDTPKDFESPVQLGRYENSPLGGDLAQAGDFDGNGKTDLVFARFETDAAFASYAYVAFTVALANDTGGFQLVDSRIKLDANRQNAYRSFNWGPDFPNRWVAGDADGDGITDLVIVTPDAYDKDKWPGVVQVLTVTSKADGTFSDPTSRTTAIPFDCWDRYSSYAGCSAGPIVEVTAGDANGDGRIDVMTARPDATNDTVFDAVPATNTGLDHGRWRTTDVTGDGRSDQVYVQYLNPGLLVRSSIADPSQASGRKEVVNVTAASTFADADMRHWLTVDVGRPGGGSPDGRADLVDLWRVKTAAGTAKTVSTVLLSNGDGAFTVKESTVINPDPLPDQRSWLPTDANGDGLVDLVRTSRYGASVRVETLLAAGDGTWKLVSDQPSVALSVTGAHRFAPADVNGDGRGDLVHVQVGGVGGTGATTETVLTLLSNGAGTWSARVETRTVATREPVEAWRPAEMNGDGRSDLVRLRRTATDVAVDRLLAAGRGTWQLVSGANTAVARPGARWHVLDLDGDGLDDVAMLSSVLNGDVRVYWGINTGLDVSLDSQPLTMAQRDVAQWAVADSDDSGTDDLVVTRRQGDAVSLFEMPPPWRRPLLFATNNGLGLETRIDLVSSAGAHAGMPLGHPLAVVRSISRNTNLAASTGPGVVKYSYAGGRFDFTHARFLGFETVTATEANTVTGTRYRQTPGCAGRAERSELQSKNGGTFWTDTTTYDDPSTSQDGPWPCQPVKQVRQECEKTAACRQMVTTRAFDSWGNATEVAEQGEFVDANSDGVDDLPADNRTRRTTFAPNVTGYLVSLPATVKMLDAAGTVASEVRTVYDSQASHLTPPLTGDATTQWALESSTGRYLDTVRTFDSHGDVTKVTDPAGRWSSTTWDATFHRFPEQQCDPVLCTQTAWDRVLGRPSNETDANGLVTFHTYDSFGRHRKTTYPDGGCLQHDYLAWGNVVAPYPQKVSESYCTLVGADVTNGTVWVQRYVDGLGRVWREDRSGGYRRERRFMTSTPQITSEEAWRDITSKTAATRFTYDDAHRLLDTIRPDGATATTHYDVGKVSVLDEAGHLRTDAFDGRGRLRSVTEEMVLAGALGDVITEYTYDALDQLQVMTDDAGLLTSWTTNSLGWEAQACDPDRGCRDRSFDDGGLVLTEKDAAGQRVENTFDAAGRRTARALYDAKGKVTDQVTWTFDQDPATGQPMGHSIGRVVRTERDSSTGKSTESRWYDERGRPTLERHCVDSRCVEDRTTWDIAGRIATIEYPDAAGVVSPSSETVTHHYDGAGRLSAVDGYVVSIGYTPDDQIAAMTLSNGTTETRSHDPARTWLSGITVDGPKGHIVETAYSYDGAGRLKGEDRVSPLPFQQRYHRDPMNRVTEVQGPAPDKVDYDTTGDITSRTAKGKYQYGDPSHPHAVTNVNGDTFGYDKNGNRTSGPTGQFEWDADGEMVAATTPAGRVTFAYDADGVRTRKNTPSGDTTYHGRYAETDGSGDIIRSYFAGSRLVARSHPSWGKRYYHPDRLGSPTAITNDTGQLIEVLHYDAFGDESHMYSQLPDDRGFTGERVDDETGLVLMGARYYDPAIGRFLSPDSVVADTRRPQTLNRYAYASNDPISRIDPSGHVDLAADPIAAAATPPPPAPSAGVTLGSSKRSAALMTLPGGLPGLTPNMSPVGPGVGPVTGHDIKGALKALLSPIGEVGKGIQLNAGSVGCMYICIEAGEVSVGVYFSPAGPDDLLFRDVTPFVSLAGAALGITPGPHGIEPAMGFAASAGVDLQGFITTARTADDNAGWQKGANLGLGPLSASYGINPDDVHQETYTVGVGIGVGGGFWDYNQYTWSVGSDYWK
jgi:RHS repeat-associated protein